MAWGGSIIWRWVGQLFGTGWVNYVTSNKLWSLRGLQVVILSPVVVMAGAAIVVKHAISSRPIDYNPEPKPESQVVVAEPAEPEPGPEPEIDSDSEPPPPIAADTGAEPDPIKPD